MKHFITAVIFLFTLSPFAEAQDTIALNNGEKIVAKHVHIETNKIYYTHFPGKYRRDDSINKSEVNCVVRKSGWKIPMIPPPWHSLLIITPGLGFSTMPYLFRSLSGDSGSTIKSYSPVYNLNIDYGSSSQYSIGIGIAWQSVKLNPYVYYNGSSANYSFNPLFPAVNIHPSPTVFQSIAVGGPDNAITESISRFNIGARMLYHIRNDDEEDFYIGGRVGLSFWTDETNPAGYNSLTSLTALSIQAIIGVRKDINKLLSINIEGGIGTPYFISLGLSFKVDTYKK